MAADSAVFFHLLPGRSYAITTPANSIRASMPSPTQIQVRKLRRVFTGFTAFSFVFLVILSFYRSVKYNTSKGADLIFIFTAETPSTQRDFFIFLLSADLPSLKLWQGREGGKQKSATLRGCDLQL
jgi:hypothetical protein